jgi:ArsR family transcriptional regulator, lead/cadmium/zinc/bismuth-responsive transcriptional repressor
LPSFAPRAKSKSSEDPSCEHDAEVQSEFSALELDRAASLFRALGDSERLRLLEMLAQNERCVSELAGAVDAGLSTVSQRLKVLRAERLITRRRVGKHIYYSLADEHIKGLVRNALEHVSHKD